MADDEDKNQDDKPNNVGNEQDRTAGTDKEADATRRKFIKNTGIAAGGVVGGSLLGGILFGDSFNTDESTSDENDDNGNVDFSETRQFFLREEDFDVLSDATERIFPEDDNGPGAIELGVPYFIDKQLAGPWGMNARMYMKRPFQDDETSLKRREIFLQGVRKINDVSNDEKDDDFTELDDDEQDEILEMFDNDDVDMNYVRASAFFDLLRQGTIEGCYADPMYGGNKNMQGWAMKEYPGPRMSNRDKIDETFEAFKKMDRKSLKTHM